MKRFEYYAALPETMLNKELDAEFFELMSGLESQVFAGAEFVKSLLELSERQWRTYNVLDDHIRKRIEKCLISVWGGQDLGLVEDIVGVMVRLGLEGISAFLGSRSLADVAPEVLNEINLALSELGGSVSDPYSGML